MKQQIVASVKEVIQDRYLTVLLGVFFALSLALLVYLAASVRPTDLQVVVHYTGFGTTNFYRDRWYYLLTFGAFVVVMAIVHAVLAYKLYSAKGRDIAVPFVWLSILMVAIAAALFTQVVNIASLS